MIVLLRSLAILVGLLMAAAPAFAEEPTASVSAASRQQASAKSPGDATPAADAAKHLPADSTTQQKLTLQGRTLDFRATAGTIVLSDDKGSPEVEVAFIAYQLDGADASTRPVTFVFNGGPGAGSAWLQLGAIGPWRLPMNGLSASTPPILVDNEETWLDFTDLVFIDPPGTGYSRIIATGEEVRKKLGL